MIIASCPYLYNLYNEGNFWKDLWPDLISNILGFGGAYLLFWLGIKNEKKKKKKDDDEELNEYLEYVKLSIKRIKNPALKQAEAFLKISNQLKERKVSQLDLIKVASFNFKWFENINKIEVQKVFFRNFPGSIKDKEYFYNQLLGRLDYMDEMSKKIEDDFKLFLDNSLKYETLFREGSGKISEIHDNIRSKFKATKDFAQLNSFEQDMVKAAEEWLKIKEPDRYDLFTMYDTYLSSQKVKDIINKHDPIDFLSALRICYNGFRNFERNQEIASRIYQNNYKGIIHSIKRIDVILKKLPDDLSGTLC